jgi:hypothetical protein
MESEPPLLEQQSSSFLSFFISPLLLQIAVKLVRGAWDVTLLFICQRQSCLFASGLAAIFTSAALLENKLAEEYTHEIKNLTQFGIPTGPENPELQRLKRSARDLGH